MIAITGLVVIFVVVIIVIIIVIFRNSMYVIQDLFRLYECRSVNLAPGLPTFLLPTIKHQRNYFEMHVTLNLKEFCIHWILQLKYFNFISV